MPSAVKRPRPYSSRLRQEQAGLTRRRVLAAARKLFVADGYAAVTMQAVAAEAEVAYQTVYAQFGGKLELALELCNSELPHVGPTIATLAQARAAADPLAWLGVMGAFARRLYEPCAEVLRFMRESGDAQLLARYGEVQAGRLELLRELGPQLQRSRLLRAGLTPKQAVDLVWLLAGPESYERLVLDQGWTPAQFESWMNTALVRLLLADR